MVSLMERGLLPLRPFSGGSIATTPSCRRRENLCHSGLLVERDFFNSIFLKVKGLLSILPEGGEKNPTTAYVLETGLLPFRPLCGERFPFI